MRFALLERADEMLRHTANYVKTFFGAHFFSGRRRERFKDRALINEQISVASTS